jgi:hypothetical protein
MNKTFILNPRVFGGKATLNLVVVDDKGVKLGVIAAKYDGHWFPVAIHDLHDFELKVVVELIRAQIAAGNIDKAFMHDLCWREKERQYADIISLFQYVPTENNEVQCRERDRVGGLIQN